MSSDPRVEVAARAIYDSMGKRGYYSFGPTSADQVAVAVVAAIDAATPTPPSDQRGHPFVLKDTYHASEMDEIVRSVEARALAGATDLEEYGWVVICNVSEGDWTKQPQEWQDAAARFREQYHAKLGGDAAYNEKDAATQRSDRAPVND